MYLSYSREIYSSERRGMSEEPENHGVRGLYSRVNIYVEFQTYKGLLVHTGYL